MPGERTMEGFAVRLKPHGWGRFASAAFLLVWICGWAAGEGFALWLLGTGAAAVMSGDPTLLGRSMPPPGAVVGIGAFLLLWLALWTIGGVAAIGELLRLVWAEDRLVVRDARLLVVRRRGPFRSTREYPRDGIVRILLAPRNGALVLETPRERAELSGLGSAGEREEAARALRAELGVGEEPDPPPIALPRGWEETLTPDGERALVPNVATRRTQARVMAAGTFLVATAALFLFRESWSFPGLLPAAGLATLAAIGLGGATAWLAHGRMEWCLGGGRIRLRRRFGANVRELFAAERLEIVVTRDGDGDEWYALEAVAAPAAGTGPVGVAPPDSSPRAARNARRKIVSTLHDPTVPLRLGAWLAKTADLPLEDRTTRESRAREIAALRVQLAASGRFGRFALRLLDSVQAGRGRQP